MGALSNEHDHICPPYVGLIFIFLLSANKQICLVGISQGFWVPQANLLIKIGKKREKKD